MLLDNTSGENYVCTIYHVTVTLLPACPVLRVPLTPPVCVCPPAVTVLSPCSHCGGTCVLDCGCVNLRNYERAAFAPPNMLHTQHKHTGSNLFNCWWASVRVGRPLPLGLLRAALHRLSFHTAPRLGFMDLPSRCTKSAQEHQHH